MKKYHSRHGGEISTGVPFELDGIAYPWNWLDLASSSDLSDRGITVQVVSDPLLATIDEKLSAIGISIAELKVALGVPGNGNAAGR
jgi:hypothetical protein